MTKIRNNLNYGKLAYEQVLDIERKNTLTKVSSEFDKKSQIIIFSLNNIKNNKVINFKSIMNNLLTLNISSLTINNNYNIIINLNNNLIYQNSVSGNISFNLNILSEKNNELVIYIDSQNTSLVNFKVEIVGRFKEATDTIYNYIIPDKNSSSGLINKSGEINFAMGTSDEILSLYNSINLGFTEVLDYKMSLLSGSFVAVLDNKILLTKDDSYSIREYNNSSFNVEYKLEIGSVDDLKYVPIIHDTYKHQLIALKDGKIESYFLNDDFSIVNNYVLDIDIKNQITNIYTLNYFNNIKYVNLFIVKDVLDNLYLYINNDETFSSESCYSSPIFIGKGGIKTFAYLKSDKIILINSHSNKSIKIEFDFKNSSKVKKISRVNEKEYLNINEVLLANKDEIVLCTPNASRVEVYE